VPAFLLGEKYTTKEERSKRNDKKVNAGIRSGTKKGTNLFEGVWS
jgi:hypothetical protein